MLDANKIIEKINEFNTREDVGLYLESLKLKKAELLAVGKILLLPISNNDNKEKIIDRIINGTIGSKLRIEAIKKIDLSRK